MTYPKGIRPRGNKFFVDVTINAVRKTATCETLQQALTVQEELKQQLLATHSSENQDSWTMKQAYDKTIETHWNDDSAKSAKKLKQVGAQVLEFFGATTRLEAVTQERIDEYVAHLKQQGLGGGTINRKLSALSKMMNVSFKRGKVSRKPLIERQREPENRIRFLTEEEETHILNTFEVWGLQDMVDVVMVLIDTGCRPSEIWRLQQRDVDMNHKLITIWESKNSNPRSIPMTTRVYDIMKKRKTLGDRLFPFNPFWLDRHWNRMRAHLNMDRDDQFIPYVCRHTFASRLIQDGESLPVVQKLMGHKSITTTLKYSHLSPKQFVNAIARLEKKKVG